MFTRLISVLASAALTVLAVVTPAAVGGAPAQARCQDPYVTYKTRLVKTVHRKFPDYPIWVMGPGGEITVTTRKSDSTTGTFGVATEAEIKGIIASAKVQVSASVARTVTAEIGVTYHHKISKGMYGHMAYGTFAKKVAWKKLLHTATCDIEVVKSGKAVIPTRKLGVRYWETK
ncbi:MAG: hypothetical protein ACOYX5_08470 [Actinomycetota bacterium]